MTGSRLCLFSGDSPTWFRLRSSWRLIGLNLVWPMPALTDQIVRLAVMAAVLYSWRVRLGPALDFRVTQWAGSAY